MVDAGGSRVALLLHGATASYEPQVSSYGNMIAGLPKIIDSYRARFRFVDLYGDGRG